MLNTNIFIGLWNLCKNLENIEKDLKGCLLILLFFVSLNCQPRDHWTSYSFLHMRHRIFNVSFKK